jgi:hypothetical protein
MLKLKNKLVLFVGWLAFMALPVFAGELYETEEYLSAIDVDDPYGDGGAPVGYGGSPSSSGGGSFNSSFDGPVAGNGPGDSGVGNNSGTSGGSYNSLPNTGNTSHWTAQDNQSRTTNGSQDYLTQALLTNAGGFVLQRSRGKGKRYETAQVNHVSDLQSVSITPRLVRKTLDKQIAYQ